MKNIMNGIAKILEKGKPADEGHEKPASPKHCHECGAKLNPKPASPKMDSDGDFDGDK